MGKVAKTVSELGRVPPSAFFSCISNHIPRHQTPLRVVFLIDDHLIVSFPDRLLILWKLSPSNCSSTMVWKLKLQEDVDEQFEGESFQRMSNLDRKSVV